VKCPGKRANSPFGLFSEQDKDELREAYRPSQKELDELMESFGFGATGTRFYKP
jgi:O-acetyl-ADP-ribose deacetylase (regulator of RNase III)